MKKFSVRVMVCGMLDYEIEAESIEEAQEIAERNAYTDNWNAMYGVSAEMQDYEEEEPNHE